MNCNSMACLWSGLQRKANQLVIMLAGGLIRSRSKMNIITQLNVQLAESSGKSIGSKAYPISEVEFEKLLSAWQKRQLLIT
jgi:hypothetical protein